MSLVPGAPAAAGDVLRSVLWHSVLFAAVIGLLARCQAYLATWMVP